MFFDKQFSSNSWLLISSLTYRVRRDSLLRNSIYLMGTTVATSAIGYLYWVAAAHIFSVYDVGLASAFISAMILTSTFANLGIGSALVQILPQHKEGYARSLTFNFSIALGTLTSLLSGIIVAIALPFLSSQFAVMKDHTVYALIFVLGVILTTLGTLLDQTFVAERASGNMAVRNAAFALLKLPIMILLIAMGAFGIIFSWVLALAATLLLGLVLIPLLKRGYRFAIRGITKQARPMLSLLAGHHFINIGGLLPMYLLPVFVTVRLSAADNAYFYTTWMLGGLFFMISSSVATALFSEGSHATGEVLRKARSSATIIGMLLGPTLLGFLLGGRYILSMFGPSYAMHGLSLLLILMISAVPDAITNIYVSILRVQRRLRSAGLLNLSMAILTLVLAWLLLPVVGIVGAGWAWLTGQVVGSLVVGIDILISRNDASSQHKEAARPSTFPRIKIRDMEMICRYMLLRLRFRNLRVRLFFLERYAHLNVGPNARVHFGRRIHFMQNFTGHFQGNVTIGDDVFFNRGCYVTAYEGLTIGNYCLFGEGVSIHDENHVVGSGPEPIASRGFATKPVVIGNNVWVGAKATILPGVHIGDNAVIGANAVVTHDVPGYTIVGGIPARLLREIKASPEPVEQNRVAIEAIRPKDAPVPLVENRVRTAQTNEESASIIKFPSHYRANRQNTSNGRKLKPTRLQPDALFPDSIPITDPDVNSRHLERVRNNSISVIDEVI